MPRIVTRPVPPDREQTLLGQGVPALLARIYAARGITDACELDHRIDALLPVGPLRNAGAMAAILADAIGAGRRLLIVADYDADGATACAVGMRALRALRRRASITWCRTGSSSATASRRRSCASRPSASRPTSSSRSTTASPASTASRKPTGSASTCWSPTTTCPATELPRARCIVNPNQPGCAFPSKHLAGVGVMFYVMLALRAELRRRGAFAAAPEPNLAELLDLVALGTVADVVRLDRNNRILVHRACGASAPGAPEPGIAALLRAAGRDARARCRPTTWASCSVRASTPPAGSTDMALGIECLVTDDATRAARDRAASSTRSTASGATIEADMQEAALAALERIDAGERLQPRAVRPAAGTRAWSASSPRA